MEVKPGYKQTDAGVIPEDWEANSGQELTTLIGKGGSPRWQGFGYTESGMLFVTSENVRDGFLDISSPKFLPLAFHERLKRTKLQKGDILINLVGASIGRSCQVRQDIGESNVNQAVAVFRVREGTSPSFVAHIFQLPLTIRRILELQVDAARQNISLTNLRGFLVPMPPTRAEQEAIAAALSDADALIESLEQLVAKKRLIKHGAMQELLTGQKRLPGFTAKWEATTLGELTSFLSGGTPSRSNIDYWTGDIPWISATSLRRFEIDRSDSNVTKEAVAAGSKMAPVGSSLLLVRGSALHNEILCGLVIRPACFNQDVKALVPKPHVVPRFLTFFIHGNAEALLKLVSSAGNTAGVLDTKLLKAFRVNLPKPPEQSAIAAVLSDMDAEITALEGKLAKARQVKQGMMQELLTGRIRLV